MVGELLGSDDGCRLGLRDSISEGLSLGTRLGASLGTMVGASVDTKLGAPLGARVGAPLGTKLGAPLGTRLGVSLGASLDSVGELVDGDPLCKAVGRADGAIDGLRDGFALLVGARVGWCSFLEDLEELEGLSSSLLLDDELLLLRWATRAPANTPWEVTCTLGADSVRDEERR